MDGEIKLVHLGKWRLARRVPASAYGVLARIMKGFVWSDPETTAYLGNVGDERGVVDLPPDPSP
jgi:hypothetical protein